MLHVANPLLVTLGLVLDEHFRSDGKEWEAMGGMDINVILVHDFFDSPRA